MPYDVADFKIDPLQLTTPRARLEYLRDFLRALPDERFDMSHPGFWEDAEAGACGSPACIGGWARALFRFTWDQRKAAGVGGLASVGMIALGLSEDDAYRLFFPAIGTSYRNIGPGHATAVLDHLLATGEVDWSVAPSG